MNGVRKGSSRAGTDFLYNSRFSVRFTTVSFVGSSINFKYASITIVSSVSQLIDIIHYNYILIRYCATSRKVAGLIRDKVIRFFSRPDPSSRIMVSSFSDQHWENTLLSPRMVIKQQSCIALYQFHK
jgi:hypothetical protein